MFLPSELQEQILLWLPVKSLLRFRSVCKLWNSLITHQNFIDDHLDLNMHKRNAAFSDSKTSSMLLVSGEEKEYSNQLVSLLTVSDQTASVVGEIPIPRIEGYIDNTVVPSIFSHYCHGMVCRVEESSLRGRRVDFYNPALGKHRAVPVMLNNMAYYGFGHDPKTGDYKFVRIVMTVPGFIAEVYSLRTGRWKDVWVGVFAHLSRQGTYLKGRCYWVDFIAMNILSFDMGDESFSTLELPFPPQKVQLGIITPAWVLLARGDSLVFVEACNVWVLEEEEGGRWAKRFEIEGSSSAALMKSVVFLKEDELLMENLERHTFSYNLRTKQLRELPIRGIQGRYRKSLSCFHYVDSLVGINMD